MNSGSKKRPAPRGNGNGAGNRSGSERAGSARGGAAAGRSSSKSAVVQSAEGEGPFRSSTHLVRNSALAAPRWSRVWLAWVTALLVVGAWIPSESAAAEGTGMVQVMLWLVLLVSWFTSGLLLGGAPLRLGPTCVAFLVFVGWHTLAAGVAVQTGEARPAWNMLWQWVSFASAFFLAQQVFVTGPQRRAVVAVMVSLAVCLSCYGFYQYGVVMPQLRADYAKNPEAELARAGIVAPPGSPERKQFENRLASTEPIATFALTNSLAGLLAPWLIVLLGGLLGQNGKRIGRGEKLVDQGVHRGDLGGNRIEPSRKKFDLLRVAAGAAVAVVTIGLCLILTKSRTAWLATGCGVVLLVLCGRQSGWRPGWRSLSLVGITASLIVVIAMRLGGIDWLVLTESVKSLQYRWEFWQATWLMIQDHPWWGCGPGNFQAQYAAYKLPQASETIADPHNWLLEIWATAGTPGMLAFLSILLLFGWQMQRGPAGRRVRRQSGEGESGGTELSETNLVVETSDKRQVREAEGNRPGEDSEPTQKAAHVELRAWSGGATSQEAASTRDRAFADRSASVATARSPRDRSVTGNLVSSERDAWRDMLAVYAGGFLGVILAFFPCGFLVGYVPAGTLLWVGVPAAGLVLTLVVPWVLAGRLSVAVVMIATGTLLLNLLAAGGISFAGVSLSLWLLLALGLNERDAVTTYWFSPPRMVFPLLLSLLLLAGCYLTAYAPILNSAAWISEGALAQQLKQPEAAERAYRRAAELDPYAAGPWQLLAALQHEQWMASGSSSARNRFARSVEQWGRRHPHSSPLRRNVGDWYLQAYRQDGDERSLKLAIQAYQEAVERYPNHSFTQAQLAWALHLAGQRDRAAAAAEEALRLDRLNPHVEQKVVNRRLFDPGPARSDSRAAEPEPLPAAPLPTRPLGSPPQQPPPSGSAEQICHQLRSNQT